MSTVQHQSTIPDFPNRVGCGLSTDTLQPQIPELRASHGTPSPSLRELQPHHTFPDASYLSGFDLSTVTHPPGISGRCSSFGTIRPPPYELQPQSVIPGDPRLSRSSVRHPSVNRFPSDGPLRETHSQSVIPGVPYLGGPVASSITHLSVIPPPRPGGEVAVIRFPSDGPLHETHSQNVIPGVPYLSGPEEEVETRTVSDKKDYQGRIF